MTEIANTPELRFPNYENSWFSYKLNDISERVTRKNKNLESQRPLTISGQLGLIDQIEYFNKSVSSKNLTGYTLIKKGEFAYNKSYSNGYPLGAIKKLERYDLGILSSLYICFSFDENIDKSFMKNYFESTKWYREVANIAVEGARNHGLLNIPVNDFFNININLPIQYEQEKIGEFFSKLDRQIELEEQKLAKLEEQKKGYMQKLFSQEIRFKDNQGNNYPDWKIVEIGDILEERTERSGEGDMLSVTINNGIIKFDEIDRKDNSSKDKSNYRKVYKDDIAYNSMRMWQGASGKSEYEGIVSPAYTVTIPSENINPDFIAYYFKTHKMIHKFKINSQGLTSDTWNLKYRQLKDIKLNLCSKEEQNKIANLLIMYDKLINKQKHKLEILKTNKKGFLQKMFV